MHPKAIETRYKGYRFRSRLEARWAVFFDYLGNDGYEEHSLPWQYEPQGFNLPSGPYLPDFWLPGLTCWVEIKPASPSDLEMRRCAELAHETDHPAVLLCGIPGSEQIKVYCSDSTDGGGGTDWWEESTGWCSPAPHWSLDKHLRPCVCSGNDWSSRVFGCPDSYSTWLGMRTVRECCHDGPARKRILAAVSAARSARFEHGETPR